MEQSKNSKFSFSNGGKSRNSPLRSIVRDQSKFQSMATGRQPKNKNDTKGESQKTQFYRVLDDKGNDVTPRPLYGPHKQYKEKDLKSNSNFNSSASGAHKSDGTQQDGTTPNFDSIQQLFGFVTSFSPIRSNSKKSQQKSTTQDDENSSAVSSSDENDNSQEILNNTTSLIPKKTKKIEEKIESPLEIHLIETDYITLLDIPSSVVVNDLDEISHIKKENETYIKAKKSIQSSDNHYDRGIQTFNGVMKNKDVQVSSLKGVHIECQVTPYDLYDMMNDLDNDQDKEELNYDLDGDLSLPSTMNTINSLNTNSMNLSGSFANSANETTSITNTTEDNTLNNGSFASGFSNLNEKILKKNVEVSNPAQPVVFDKKLVPKLVKSLRLMESVVNQNNVLRKLVSYKNLPEIQPISSYFENDLKENRNNDKAFETLGSSLPSLQLLWSFKHDITKGRNVNSICWNKKNQKIIAVGYSDLPNNKSQIIGLILLWSLTNLEYPEKIFKCSSAVTSLDFSTCYPGILAAGFYDGRVCVYDIRKDSDELIFDTTASMDRHREAVWDIRFVESLISANTDDDSMNEVLVSISVDGRMIEWHLKKGMESTVIMTLKRISNPKEKNNDSKSSFVSRISGGLSFDFSPKDPHIYLAATEEGLIHKCSRNYDEQFLDSIFAHTGPIYRVKWNNFLPSVYLSAGSDWAIRLWHEDFDKAILEFQGGKASINDVNWSPHSSTIFGSVSSDGRIEIWDLSHSQLNPVVLHSVLDHQLTKILFAPNTSCLLTGDDNGVITVYKIRNFPNAMPKDLSLDAQKAALEDIIKVKKQQMTNNLIRDNDIIEK